MGVLNFWMNVGSRAGGAGKAADAVACPEAEWRWLNSTEPAC
jgi:hypothetical protein